MTDEEKAKLKAAIDRWSFEIVDRGVRIEVIRTKTIKNLFTELCAALERGEELTKKTFKI